MTKVAKLVLSGEPDNVKPSQKLYNEKNYIHKTFLISHSKTNRKYLPKGVMSLLLSIPDLKERRYV